jgi:hypothetical protein
LRIACNWITRVTRICVSRGSIISIGVCSSLVSLLICPSLGSLLICPKLICPSLGSLLICPSLGSLLICRGVTGICTSIWVCSCCWNRCSLSCPRLWSCHLCTSCMCRCLSRSCYSLRKKDGNKILEYGIMQLRNKICTCISQEKSCTHAQKINHFNFS